MPKHQHFRGVKTENCKTWPVKTASPRFCHGWRSRVFLGWDERERCTPYATQSGMAKICEYICFVLGTRNEKDNVLFLLLLD